MASQFRQYKNIAEHFNCPIHLGKLKDPRRLACEHTLCADCLNGCIKTALTTRKDGMFECPVCRTKHHIPTSEGRDWARGFPIDAFCVIQLHTLAQYEKSAVCETHIQKFKEYFCFHHRMLLCSDCVIEAHTKPPCSCGSIQDSILEVRLQIKELISKLKTQEDRVEKILEAQEAATHSDELVMKIKEVERLLSKFYKTMRVKLKESKQKAVESTKISQSDKDRLLTLQSLITKTRSHVDTMVRPEKTKRVDAANDILSLWAPLEAEITHFDEALDDIENRPNRVTVQADEEFLDFISYDKNPLFVSTESENEIPSTPVKEKNQLHVSFMTDSQSTTMGCESSTLSSPIMIRRNISLSPPMKLGNQKLYADKRPFTHEESPRQSPQRHLSPSRASRLIKSSHAAGVLPKVGTGELISRDTDNQTHGVDVKLKGISEVSNFELPCGDIVLVSNHLITVTETAVQKFTTDYQFKESLAIRCPWKMCAIKETTNVAVNHNTRFITIVATFPTLCPLYRIETNKPYSQICHMRTQIVEDRFGRTKYHEHFALTHTTDLRADCIDLITVTYDQNPYSNFTPSQVIKLQPLKTKTIIGSDKHAVARSPNALAATSNGKRLIIGAESAVLCVRRTGDIVWTRPVTRFVASVCCDKGLVFVCIENEQILMVLDEHGNNLFENIFPFSSNIMRPNRLSIEKNLMIVREFSEKDWKSTVHVFAMTYMQL